MAGGSRTAQISRRGFGLPWCWGRDAILLAEELGADQIVIDEIPGRREPKRRRIPCEGTLGVLAAVADHGLVDLRYAVDRPRRTNFRVRQKLLEHSSRTGPETVTSANLVPAPGSALVQATLNAGRPR